MDPLRMYEYLVLARGKVFERVRPLSHEQYLRAFPIGLGSLGRTLTHTMISEWFYVQRIEQRQVPPYAQWPIQDEHPPVFAVLEDAWAQQATLTQRSLEAVGDWDEMIEYRSLAHPDEADAQEIIISASVADIFTQLALHEVHHRAQALHMIRLLAPDGAVGDLDFNALMYDRRPAAGG